MLYPSVRIFFSHRGRLPSLHVSTHACPASEKISSTERSDSRVMRGHVLGTENLLIPQNVRNNTKCFNSFKYRLIDHNPAGPDLGLTLDYGWIDGNFACSPILRQVMNIRLPFQPCSSLLGGVKSMQILLPKSDTSCDSSVVFARQTILTEQTNMAIKTLTLRLSAAFSLVLQSNLLDQPFQGYTAEYFFREGVTICPLTPRSPITL